MMQGVALGGLADRAPGGRTHLLVEIADFAVLRRRIGYERSGMLAPLVAERLASALPCARCAPIARDQIACDIGKGAGEGGRGAGPDYHATVSVALKQPFTIDGRAVRISAITGIAHGQPSDGDALDLVERAEAALATARAALVAATQPLAAAQVLGRNEAARFACGIDADELVLHYQPKVHVRRQEINSAEALVRWRHPDRGMVMPNDFIPLAEEHHLVGRMTLWVIRRAIEDQRALTVRGHELRLFINISGQLLADEAFVRDACHLVGTSDAKLGFEITETSVIRDPARAIANLQTFADFGITITIDDYGAGLSSLAYLKQLPARELKIDKMFVTQLTSSHRDPLIVRSTIDLAHALEMEVVAEGVETHAALALLTVMGCDMVQGFLISRPIPLDALMTYLEDGQLRAPASYPLVGGTDAARRHG